MGRIELMGRIEPKRFWSRSLFANQFSRPEERTSPQMSERERTGADDESDTSSCIWERGCPISFL